MKRVKLFILTVLLFCLSVPIALADKLPTYSVLHFKDGKIEKYDFYRKTKINERYFLITPAQWTFKCKGRLKTIAGKVVITNAAALAPSSIICR